LNGGQNVFSTQVEIKYDPKVMTFVNVSNAGALSRDGQAVALVHRDDQEQGTVILSMMRPPGASGIDPTGPLFTMMFVAKAPGQGVVTVGNSAVRNPNNEAI